MFKKGQSIVEYVLVLAAIVIAVAAYVKIFVWGSAGVENTAAKDGLVGLYESRLGDDSRLDTALDNLATDLGL